ncbi:hypothetical protein ACHAQA_002211 [Verticillium albo-atrum]
MACFNDLPAELRIEIWTLCLQQERILYAPDFHPDGFTINLVTVGPSPVSVTQTCFEAREVAMRICFRIPFQVDPRNGGKMVDLWFNDSTMVFLGPSTVCQSVLARFTKPELPGLRRLALDLPRKETSGIDPTVENIIQDIILQHRGVKDIVLHRSVWKRCPEPLDPEGPGRCAVDRLAEALGWYLDVCQNVGQKSDRNNEMATRISRTYTDWKTGTPFQQWVSWRFKLNNEREGQVRIVTEEDGWPYKNNIKHPVWWDIPGQDMSQIDPWIASSWDSVYPPNGEDQQSVVNE